MTSMDDLVAFLRARLDEDERHTRKLRKLTAEDQAWMQLPPDSQPDRYMLDIDAKRQIIKLHEPCSDEPECHVCGPHGSSGACLTLCLLALPYADHPDYRGEWRP